MTKIFEALQNARRDNDGSADRALALLPQTLPERNQRELPDTKRVDVKPDTLELKLASQMTSAFLNMQTSLPYAEGNIIQFISSEEGEGCPAIAREFAKTVALNMDKRVLLLDANGNQPSQMKAFGVLPDHGWGECVRGEVALDEVLYRLGETSLYVSQLTSATSSDLKLANLRNLSEFCDDLSRRFDLIVIDSPPLSESGEGLTLAGKVDGVALVVQAESTRREVVKNTRDKIDKFDGKILGVILSDCKMPIPGFIYNRL